MGSTTMALRGRVGQPTIPMSLDPDGAYSLGLKIGRRSCDLVLVEGYKTTPIAKIEVHRPELGKSLIWPQPLNIVALATDAVSQMAAHVSHMTSGAPLPVFDLNDIEAIAGYISQTPDYAPC